MPSEHKKTVYFVASLAAKDKFGKYYLKIAEIFRDLGYEVFDDVNNVNSNEARSYDKQKITRYFSKVQKMIRQSDIFVAEASHPSSAIGYEIGYAVGNNKPVLALRKEGLDEPGAPLRGNPSKLLTWLTYNEDNLKKKIKNFLRKAEKGIFVKRLPIEFTHNQVEYVEFRQGRGPDRQSFNASVREIIEEARSDDEKFKKFLAQF